ncbi:MAG TPA: hypothetical protein VGI45_28325 [Terracidiphilus sp.]|jgi:hypothetical protein
MPPREGIRTYVPEKHKPQTGPARERGDYVETNKTPALIRLFVWLLVFRLVVNLIFALTIGLAPDSSATAFITTNFDPWPKKVSAEAMFYITALIYGVMAWRWHSRDWKVRWAAMFVSGATALKMLVNFAGDQAAGMPTPMTQNQIASLFVSVAVNLAICGYLAFYPGMAQAFKETPWE